MHSTIDCCFASNGGIKRHCLKIELRLEQPSAQCNSISILWFPRTNIYYKIPLRGRGREGLINWQLFHSDSDPFNSATHRVLNRWRSNLQKPWLFSSFIIILVKIALEINIKVEIFLISAIRNSRIQTKTNYPYFFFFFST